MHSLLIWKYQNLKNITETLIIGLMTIQEKQWKIYDLIGFNEVFI